MSHQSDLPPHVPSCVSTGAGVTVPDATATPRTDANTGKAIAGHYGPSDSTDLYACSGGPFVHADFARTLERELTAAKAEIAELKTCLNNEYERAEKYLGERNHAEAQLRERTQWQCKCGGTDCAGQAENERLRTEVERLKADNESLRTLWTEIRTVLIQSRAANCVCSYGAQQADAVEAANAVLKRMPPDVTSERDQLRARVGELEAAINSARSMAYGAPELNMCNYDHEQVRQLNDAMCEVFTILDAARAGKGTP